MFIHINTDSYLEKGINVNAISSYVPTMQGPFFLGKELSLVDITFTPMLERIAASLTYYKGYMIRGEGRWPQVDRWFAAMEQRETYLGTKSDYYTHCHDLPPQLGGCAMTPSGQKVVEGRYNIMINHHTIQVVHIYTLHTYLCFA
jgi:hypothetical protein